MSKQIQTETIAGGRAPLETIAKHFVIACIWADCPEGTHTRETKQALTYALEQAYEFVCAIGAENFARIKAAHADGYGTHPDCGDVFPWCAALGHDFYLTRQGHGVGFKDRQELPEDLRDTLAEMCYYAGQFKPCNPEFYRGWLYIR